MSDGSRRLVPCEALAALLAQSAHLSVPQVPGWQSIDERAAKLASLLKVGIAMHWSLQGGRVPDAHTLYLMARKLLVRLESRETPPVVQPDNAEALRLQNETYKLFEQGKITVSMDCPGFAFLFHTLAVLILNSWFRNNRCAIYDKEHLFKVVNRKKLIVGPPNTGRAEVLRHGVRAKGGKLCVSIALNAFMADKIAPTGPLPALADGTPAHNMTVDFDTKQSSKIDPDMVYALAYLRQALKKRCAAWTEGMDNATAVKKLIELEQPFVAEIPCAAMAELVPHYRGNLYDYVGDRLGTMALLLDEPSDNLLTVFTCKQMGSALCDPSTMHRSANMQIHFFHEHVRAFIHVAGGPAGAMEPFDGVSRSALAALLRTPGDKAFDELLHRKGLLAPTDCYCCPSVAGGQWSPYDELKLHGCSREQIAELVEAVAAKPKKERAAMLASIKPPEWQSPIAAIVGNKVGGKEVSLSKLCTDSKNEAQRAIDQKTKRRVEEQAKVWTPIFLGQSQRGEAAKLVAIFMLREDIAMGGGKLGNVTRHFSAELLAHLISAMGGPRTVKKIETLQADLLARC